MYIKIVLQILFSTLWSIQSNQTDSMRFFFMLPSFQNITNKQKKKRFWAAHANNLSDHAITIDFHPNSSYKPISCTLPILFINTESSNYKPILHTSHLRDLIMSLFIQQNNIVTARKNNSKYHSRSLLRHYEAKNCLQSRCTEVMKCDSGYNLWLKKQKIRNSPT